MTGPCHLVLIRHGPTAWSAEKRLQGRRDIPLSQAGAAMVATWRVPPAWRSWRWHTSPLTRAHATAALLHSGAIDVTAALIEMDFGAWEGLTSADLPASETSRGLTMTPPSGESPAMVQARLRPWLSTLAEDTVAVTHKGVIRAVLGLATGWSFLGKPPVRLDWTAGHLFAVEAGLPRYLSSQSLLP